jgi:hypothetical protein
MLSSILREIKNLLMALLMTTHKENQQNTINKSIKFPFLSKDFRTVSKKTKRRENGNCCIHHIKQQKVSFPFSQHMCMYICIYVLISRFSFILSTRYIFTVELLEKKGT